MGAIILKSARLIEGPTGDPAPEEWPEECPGELPPDCGPEGRALGDGLREPALDDGLGDPAPDDGLGETAWGEGIPCESANGEGVNNEGLAAIGVVGGKAELMVPSELTADESDL